jgi:Cd2+/Zn2+-exporting ATPase
MADPTTLTNPAVEGKLQLDASSLIPELSQCQGACLERLESALNGNGKVQRAHIKHEQGAAQVCLHYDPARMSAEQAQRIAARAGSKIASRYRHDVYPVEGMDCSDCAMVLEHGLGRVEGIFSARVSYADETLRLEYDARQISRPAIRRSVKNLGYRIPPSGITRWYIQNHMLLLSLLSGLSLLVGWLGERFFGFPYALSLAFYLAAYLLGGWHTAIHTARDIRQRRFDVDMLMLMAALGAAAIGQYPEGALLLFLFSLGHALEERALNRARRSIRALADLAPRHAVVRRDGSETLLPVERVAIDDIVIVRPGERFPVDGRVLSGSSAVDQAPVTGESVPVDKAPGDQVYAGSVNGEGALDVKATRLARDSTLRRVMRMVERAQSQKSPTQQLTERFMAWYVPAVLLIALAIIILPPLIGMPFATSFIRAMTFLVAASPCALALGTPSAVLAGTARAARGGVLVKGGLHLENLGRLRAAAFDKTGTLTSGQLTVTDVVTYPAGNDAIVYDGIVNDGVTSDDELLRLAAGVESRSAHPLAQAVVRAAEERSLTLPYAVDVQAISGRGIQAAVGSTLVWVGSRGWFEQQGVEPPQTMITELEKLESAGKTVVLVRKGESFVGLVALADVVRPEARQAIADLLRMGLQKIVMLSGDNQRTAAHIAAQTGIPDYRAGLLPEDKLTVIQNLVERYQVVAMVGDGVNDAPALANATVGIAMGSAGSDAALETADVALMSSNLDVLPFAVGLGRATLGTVRQNLAIAIGVILALSAASILGWAGIGLAILLHEGSTLLVVLNGLRLLRYRQ